MIWPFTDGLATRFSLGIERYSRTIASNLLDFWDVKHYLSGSQMDLPNIRLDFSGGELAWDGPLLLMFIALVILVIRRATLLPCLAFLLSVPLLSLVGSTLMILIQVWGSESLGENWSANGDSHIYLRLGIFCLELMLLWLTYVGVSFLLAPIPADSEQEARRGVAAMFNQVVVWPMAYVPPDEEVGYYEEDDPAASKMTNMPDYVATKNATDPWMDSRWFYPASGFAGLTLLFGVICWFVPSDLIELPEPLGDGTVATLVAQSVGADLDEVTFEKSGSVPDSEKNIMTWSYTSAAGPLLLKASLPNSGFVRTWEQDSSELTLLGPPRRRVVVSENGERWPVLECEFRDSGSSLVYAWFTAFEMDSRTPKVPEQTFSAQFRNRLSQTLFGRLFSEKNESVTCMFALELRTSQVKTRRTLREISETATKLFQDCAAKLPEL